jgi:hypothetical protein
MTIKAPDCMCNCSRFPRPAPAVHTRPFGEEADNFRPVIHFHGQAASQPGRQRAFPDGARLPLPEVDRGGPDLA